MGGETIRVETRGETTRGETTRGETSGAKRLVTVTTGTGYCLVGFNWIIDFLN